MEVERKLKTTINRSGLGQTYLFIYNVIYSVLFIFINYKLCARLLTDKLDNEFVLSLANFVKWVTYFQFIEVLHPILGLIPGGYMMPLMQTFGRSLNITLLCNPSISGEAGYYGPALIFVWATVECIRYPYYALKIFDIDSKPLTWLKYTIFMPLYPMGGLFEFMVFQSAINEYERSGALSYQMPNNLNISLSLPSFLKIHSYILLAPAIFRLMQHMCSQREKVLSPDKEKYI